MQKKLIALALASAFAAPAFAATSNVDIGGTMNFSVDYLDGDSPNHGGNVNVSSNASNIYFKGTEDLGGGLKALWQVQTFFSGGGTGNTDNNFGGQSDGVSSGDTFVGLSGGFGTVILGKNESPVKLLSRKVDFFNNQIGDSRNLTVDKAGIGGGFDTRPNNLVAYATPNFSGFSGTIGYFSNLSNGPASDSLALATGTITGVDYGAPVDGYAVAGQYENGPLFVGLGYEQHNTSNAGLTAYRGDENVWRLAAGYTIGNFKMTGLYQQTSDNGGYNGADRTVWGLGAGYNMDAFLFKVQYYNAGDMNTALNPTGNSSGADMWALGVDYSMSKRTKLQFAYADTNNDSNAAMSAFGGGHGDNPGTRAGGNPTGFSMGVVHSF